MSNQQENAMTPSRDNILELAWQPEIYDYVEAFRARIRTRKTWYKALGTSAIIIAIAIGLSLTLGRPSTYSLSLFIVAALLPILILVLQPLSVRTLWRRNPALHTPVHASIDPVNGINITAQANVQHPWSNVHAFLETPNVFVIELPGYRSRPFFLLAKRGLADQTQVDELRALLTRNTGQQ